MSCQRVSPPWPWGGTRGRAGCAGYSRAARRRARTPRHSRTTRPRCVISDPLSWSTSTSPSASRSARPRRHSSCRQLRRPRCRRCLSFNTATSRMTIDGVNTTSGGNMSLSMVSPDFRFTDFLIFDRQPERESEARERKFSPEMVVRLNW